MSNKTGDLSCGTCTIEMVRIAYGRNYWFRLIRGPLALSMRAMGRLYGIEPYYRSGHDRKCGGCIRFTKIQLKERSALFNFMNRMINPVFDRLLGGLIAPEELSAAKETALRATGPNRCGAEGRDGYET